MIFPYDPTPASSIDFLVYSSVFSLSSLLRREKRSLRMGLVVRMATMFPVSGSVMGSRWIRFSIRTVTASSSPASSEMWIRSLHSSL